MKVEIAESVGADIVIGAIILGSFALGFLSWKWCLLKNWSPTIMILSVPPAFGFGLFALPSRFRMVRDVRIDGNLPGGGLCRGGFMAVLSRSGTNRTAGPWASPQKSQILIPTRE
jgi:hypothetical protein